MTLSKTASGLTAFSVLLTASCFALAEGVWVFAVLAVMLSGLNVYGHWRGRPFYLAAWTCNFIACTAFAFVYIDCKVISGDFLLGFGHFLVLMQLLHLFREDTTRNYVLVYFMGLVLMAAAAAETVELAYGYCVFVYVIVATWALALVNIDNELAKCSYVVGGVAATPREVRENVAVRGSFLLRLCGLLPVYAIVAAAIFVVMPRTPRSLFVRSSAGPVEDPITGFSEDVELGDIGSIKENFDLVMEVTPLEEPSPEDLAGPFLWRGVALDRYEEGRWRVYQPKGDRTVPTRRMRNLRGGLNRVIHLPRGLRDDDSLEPRRTVHQRIRLRPLDTRALFGVYAPVAIKPMSGFNKLQYDYIGDHVMARYWRRQRWRQREYEIWSEPVPRDAARLRRAEARHFDPAMQKVYYLQLPTLSDRIGALAREVAPDRKCPTAYDKAEAVERFLSTSGTFRYTLTVTATPDVDPIEDFLFNRRAGHCEYFASAMVILLRSLGIPSRLVNGFKGGEWVQAKRVFRVRQSDAHSWVEVYFGGVGWVTFDPTSEDADTVDPRPSLWERLAMLFDYASLHWAGYVVGYSPETQKKLVGNVSDFWTRLSAKVASLGTSFSADMAAETTDDAGASRRNAVLLACFALLAIAVGLAAGWRVGFGYFRSAERGRRARTISYRFFADMLRVLGKKGFAYRPSLTPREFAASVVREGGARMGPAADLTEIFCRVRYGGAPLTPGDEVQIGRCLSELARVKP